MQKQTTKSKVLLAAGAFALVLVAAAAMTFLSGSALSSQVIGADDDVNQSPAKRITCPSYAPPASGWCDGGTIVAQPKDANGCTVPPKCEKPTTCKVCAGGKPTDKKDSNGCLIYSCPIIAPCPSYSPPPSGWCAGGTIVAQPKDVNGCTVPSKCEKPTTCKVCTGGTLTDKKDSAGCPIYDCPGITCPSYSPPPSGWCAGGTIVAQPKDVNGCTVPPECVEEKICPAGCTCSGEVTTCPVAPPTPTCKVCTGGTLTDKRDSSGCLIYSCPIIAPCPSYSPPPSGWCAGGTIVAQPKDANGCTVPPECKKPITCKVCVGGKLTDKKDSTGCPIYACPTITNEDNKKTFETSENSKKPVSRFFSWSCKDSDGGINAEKKGTVTTVLRVLKKEFSKKYTDKNQGKNGIVEYYCDNNKMQSKNIKCENGAVDGACKTAEEDAVITVSVTGDTPPADILVAGTNEVNLANFKITSTKDIVINKLQVTNSGNDENIVNLILINSESTKTAFLTDHVAEFGGLNFKVPANTTRLFSIEAKLNTISDGAKSGGKIKIGLLTDGFEAIDQATGTKITNPGFTGTLWGNEMTVYETKPTVTLSSSSPTGSRTVAMSDDVFIFTVAANNAENVRLNQITVYFNSDGSLNQTDISKTYLREGGSVVAEGNLIFANSSDAQVTFIPTNSIEISKGMLKNFSLGLDTTKLIIDEAGKDDLLTANILLGNAWTDGGFWWSDTNTNNIKWVGSGESTLMGNTLKY